jgi:hypothetical protein
LFGCALPFFPLTVTASLALLLIPVSCIPPIALMFVRWLMLLLYVICKYSFIHCRRFSFNRLQVKIPTSSSCIHHIGYITVSRSIPCAHILFRFIRYFLWLTVQALD